MPYTGGGGGGGTGHWPVGGRAEIWPLLLQKPSPRASQRERCCSHFTSAHQGFCLPEGRKGNLQFPEGHRKGWWRPAPWPSGASACSGAGSKAAATADSDLHPLLPPDQHTNSLTQSHPPSSSRFLSAQDGPPVFTEATFPLQVQKACSSAPQEPGVANTSQACSG